MRWCGRSYVFARHFKPQRAGAIINVSSVAAYLSSSPVGVYSGIKHALEVFTSALRVELSASGVRVGSIAPERPRPRSSMACAAKAPRCAPIERRRWHRPMSANAVRFMLEQPEHANVARMLLVSARESV